MLVTHEKVEDLIPYASNSRTHSEQQIAQIAASIREFGWTNPVLINDENSIIAGHGRLLAARQLKMTEVPCIKLDHLTKSQQKALVIADNQLALNAGWDVEVLKAEISGLDTEGFDLDLLGFDSDFLDGLLIEETEGLTDEDAVPDVPEEPETKLGDVWILGRHRLMCGDSTSADDVAKALNGVEPHLMVTDPPYGVEYDANWRNGALAGKPRSDGKIGGGGKAIGKVENDNEADWREAWALFPGDVAYVWHADRFSHHVAASLEVCDMQMRALIIWAKNQLVIGRRLSSSARAMLVCCPQRTQRPLLRWQEADNSLEHRQASNV